MSSKPLGNGKKRINSIIVGMGEIGKGLKNVLSSKYEVCGIDKENTFVPLRCDNLNVCIPYSDKFVKIVNAYVKEFEPICTIVHSTVPPGTTSKLKGTIAVHSPVMAKHPNVDVGLKVYTKFIGWDDEKGRVLAGNYLGKVMKICGVEGSHKTELMKILSLCRYGLYLRTADEMDRLCLHFDVDYNMVVKLWEQAYNEGIRKFEPEMVRPIYDAPKGKIGGHCVLPVMEILNDKFHSPIIAEVLKKYQSL